MTSNTEKKSLRDRFTGETSGFFIAAIATAPPTWTLAFNLGAYGTVFYSHLFAVWAASIAMFLATLWIRFANQGRDLFSWRSSVLLLLPSLWIVFDVLAIGSSSGFISTLSVALMIAVVLLSVPYIVYFLIMAVVPEVETIRSKKLQFGLVAIVGILALCGFLAGSKNYLLMTCEDFLIAGDTEPANCWPLNQ